MSEYRILPRTSITGLSGEPAAYVSVFDDKQKACDAALNLAAKYRVTVDVMLLVTTARLEVNLRGSR